MTTPGERAPLKTEPEATATERGDDPTKAGVGAPAKLEIGFDSHVAHAHPGAPTAADGSEEPHRLTLSLEVAPQPDDTTCGPTCLHGVYRYFGDRIDLDEVVSSVTPLPGGGTLAVWLANHALKRGYKATIYTYNLQVFDPTWFVGGVNLADRLRQQAQVKTDSKLALVTPPYLEFLGMGGQLRLGEKTSTVIRRYLKRGIPILTGLSATYLYRCARETEVDYDDVAGVPLGHFVVLSGYDKVRREVMVADPLKDNPGFGQQKYAVSLERLIASIMLGIVTYDANLLVLEPPRSKVG